MRGVDGKALAELRHGYDLSQATLARLVNATNVPGRWYPQTVMKVEKGERGLTLAEGLTLAALLDVDPAVLVDERVRP